MPREITYWPVFRFNAGVVGEFKVIGIFTSEAEAQAFSDEVNRELGAEKPQAIPAEFTLDGIKSHIIQYWIAESIPQGSKFVIENPAPVPKEEEAAA
jgi:hypothetical protein